MKFPHEGVVTAISAGSIKIKCTKHCEIGFPGKYHSHEYYPTTDSDWRVLKVKLLKSSFSTPGNRLQATINPFEVRYIKVAPGRDAVFRNDDSSSSVTVYYDEFSYHEILFSSKNQTSLKVGDIIDSDTVLMSHDMGSLSQSGDDLIPLPTALSIEYGRVLETTDSEVLISHAKECRYFLTDNLDLCDEFEISNADPRLHNKTYMMRSSGKDSSPFELFVFIDTRYSNRERIADDTRHMKYFTSKLTKIHNLDESNLIVDKNDYVSFNPTYDHHDNLIPYTPFVFGTKIQDAHIRHFIASLKPYFAREINCESEQLSSLVNKIQCLLNHFCFNDLSLLVFTQIYLLQYAQNRHNIFQVLNSTLGSDQLQLIFAGKTADRPAPSSLFRPGSEHHDTFISTFNELVKKDTGYHLPEFISFETNALSLYSSDRFLKTVFLAMLATRDEHFPEGTCVCHNDASVFDGLLSEEGQIDILEPSLDEKSSLHRLAFLLIRFRIKLRLCEAIESFDDSFRRFSRVSVEDSLSAVAMTDQTLLTPESCRQLIEQADCIMKYGYQHQSAHSDTRNASTSSSLSITDAKTDQEERYSLDSVLDQLETPSPCVLPEGLDWPIFGSPDKECILPGDEVFLGVPEDSLASFPRTSRKRPASNMLFSRERESRHVGPSSTSAGAFLSESTSVL